jgi:hypothetical protein
MPTASPRVPLDPILDKVDPHRTMSCRDLGHILGCSKNSVSRWLAHGIPVWSADAIAVYAGWMPWEIWPEFDQLTLPADDFKQGVLL